ncbi:MAG: DUF262 domain-containing protein [Anaerolineaceae bacterium]|nr:DUF262 domain-containing protein [Anaerolineaceae bacterium]
MEANVWQVGHVFNRGGDVHFVIPEFQRPYAWEQTEWQALWDDLLEMHSAGNQARHFLGAIVVVNDEIRVHVPTYTLIDGQQRLLTLSLLLLAMSREAVDETLVSRIKEYLVNRHEQSTLRYKVLPTEHYGDQKTWLDMLADREVEEAGQSRLLNAYQFFVKVIRQETSVDGQLSCHQLFDTLINRLQVVFINLKREERPHQIFESLNARGRSLEQADLVRNYLAMCLPANEQDTSFRQYWLPIQDMFEERRSAGISDFLLNYLASKTGVFYREDDTYRQFRKRVEKDFGAPDALINELATLHGQAKYFVRFLSPDTEPNLALRKRLVKFNALERTVVRPLLLHLYEANHEGKLSCEEFLEALDLLDNYLTRHFLASFHTGGLRRFLTSLVRVDSLHELKRRLHSRNYPTDERLRSVLLELDLYRSGPNRKRLVYILTRINAHIHPDDDTFPLVGAPTVEHIMPRSLNDDWEREIRREWKNPDELRSWLNRIGNLTLVTQRWNSIMSNDAWHDKRSLLRKHGLALNNQYFGEGQPGDVPVWNEKAIQDRGNWIIDAILDLWPDLRECIPVNGIDPQRHPRPGVDYKNSGVTGITLFGKQMNVYANAWNNATQMFTNEIAVARPDFEEIMRNMEIRKLARSGGYKQLDNGLWLNYMNPNEAAIFLEELADICELDEADWSISVKFYD